MIEYNSRVEGRCSDEPTNQELAMELNTEEYYLKSVNDFFEVLDGENQDKSLVRFFEITKVLRDCDYACCPLAYRLGDKYTDYPQDAIVFENLHYQGYRIGLPRESPSERHALVAAIREAALKRLPFPCRRKLRASTLQPSQVKM